MASRGASASVDPGGDRGPSPPSVRVAPTEESASSTARRAPLARIKSWYQMPLRSRTGLDERWRGASMKLTDVLREAGSQDDIAGRVREFEQRYGGEVRGGRDERKTHYREILKEYYDLATDLYEYGWGRSFHFAGRRKGESFAAALARSEHYLALRLGLEPGMLVADLGCGIGGPMHEIARFSGAKIVGINSSGYQIRRATQLSQVSGLGQLLSFMECDFMNIDAPDASYDAVYSIQSICCAPGRCWSLCRSVSGPEAGWLLRGLRIQPDRPVR